MKSSTISMFIVGLLIGLLTATTGFALYVRAGSGGSGASAAGRDKLVLKMAHSLTIDHPVHKAMELIATRMAEKSGGTVEVQIFPNGQLGSEQQCLEQLQRGALAMTKVSASPMESFIPEMAVFSIPYVFRDADHFWKVLESDVGKKLLTQGESKGLIGLCWYDSGSRSFYTNGKPILSPDDLVGQKIRVMQSKTAMDMITAFGGAPTPVPWGELYTALQSGMVDGAENNAPSVVSARHYEVSKHYVLDEHSMIPDIVLISTSAWYLLPQRVQGWLHEAAVESSQYQRKLWAEAVAKDLAMIESKGVKIYRNVNKQPFIEKVQPMHNSYAGTPVGDLLKQFKEMK